MGFGVAYANDRHLLVTALGRDGSGGGTKRGDRVLEIDLGTGHASVMAQSKEPFVLGDVLCGGESGERVCYAADAESGVLRRWDVTRDGALKQQREPVRVETAIGLPPRHLGTW